MRARFWLCVLVSIMVGAGVSRAEDSWRLGSKVRPTFEAIKLKIDMVVEATFLCRGLLDRAIEGGTSIFLPTRT